MRAWHRRIGLLLCLPCLLWGASGAVLAWKHWAAPSPPGHPEAVIGERTPFVVGVEGALALTGRGDPPAEVRFTWLLSRPRYLVRYEAPERLFVVDGLAPRLLPLVDEALARQVAAAQAGEGIAGCGLAAPGGLVVRLQEGQRAWRCTAASGDDIYIDGESGEVMAHVDGLFRLVRVSYRALHIWDLSAAPGRKGSFLVLLAAALSLCALSLSGVVLLLRWGRRRR